MPLKVGEKVGRTNRTGQEREAEVIVILKGDSKDYGLWKSGPDEVILVKYLKAQKGY